MARDSSEHLPIDCEIPPTRQELARLLRDLRRRQARERIGKPLSYRELAASTGWGTGTVSNYFTGKVLPPTDRFDVLVRLLGATAPEQGALATFRDRVEECHLGRQAPETRPTSPVPRQLPAPPMPFVGRADELAAMTALAD